VRNLNLNDSRLVGTFPVEIAGMDYLMPVWKPAIQQIWKSALHQRRTIAGTLPAFVVTIQMFSTKQMMVARENLRRGCAIAFSESFTWAAAAQPDLDYQILASQGLKV
jgi:hypothetical protein